MSRMAAIDLALRLQLAEDGREVDYHVALAQLSAPDGTAKPYTSTTIRPFLKRVADRLRLDDPPLILQWTTLDPAQCVESDLGMLMDTISMSIPFTEPGNIFAETPPNPHGSRP